MPLQRERSCSIKDESVLLVTYDRSLADAILKEYNGPITGHQIKVCQQDGFEKWAFVGLELPLLDEVLDSRGGDYSMGRVSCDGLLRARVGNEVYFPL